MKNTNSQRQSRNKNNHNQFNYSKNEKEEIPHEQSGGIDTEKDEINSGKTNVYNNGATHSQDSLDERRQNCTEEELQECCQEYIEGWRRAKADFENYKKRESTERAETYSRAKAEYLEELLPIIDNVDAAFQSIPHDAMNNPWVQGIRYIQDQFQSYLDSQGVVPIQAEGQEFQEEFHEAVEAKNHRNSSIKKNKKQKQHNNTRMIIEKEIRKGYMFNGKVLRPSRVIVNIEQ